MSFRYTNNLIGALKHRLLLEAAHRECARRTFTGQCNGIAVTCTGYGTVLSMRIVDPARALAMHTSPSNGTATATAVSPLTAAAQDDTQQQQQTTTTLTPLALDLARLATSIRAAVWDAVSAVQSAKLAAHQRALADNEQLQAHGRLAHWYEHDAATLQPRPCDALKQELATSWMQAVRFGKANASRYLGARDDEDRNNNNNDGNDDDGGGGGGSNGVADGQQQQRRGDDAMWQRRVRVLDAADCAAAALPISAAYALYTPSVWQLERHDDDDGADAHDDEEAHSNVDARTVRSEYKTETARDEQLFWERVELIRRAQLATIPGGVKRSYADQANTVIDTTDEKVELRFTQ